MTIHLGCSCNVVNKNKSFDENFNRSSTFFVVLLYAFLGKMLFIYSNFNILGKFKLFLHKEAKKHYHQKRRKYTILSVKTCSALQDNVSQ